MCGIVGYIGKDRAASVSARRTETLGIPRLHSSGLATLRKDSLHSIRRTGRVAELEAAVGEDLGGELGISHTRWATHGDVTEALPTPIPAAMVRSRLFITA